MSAAPASRRPGGRRAGRFLRSLVHDPSESSAAVAADRALVLIWSMWRFTTVAAYLPAFPVHRRNRRTAWVVPSVSVVQVAVGAWVARNLARRRRVGATLGVDVAVACITLAAAALDCNDDAVPADVRWPQQLGTSTTALWATMRPAHEATVVAIGLGAVGALVGRRSSRPFSMEWTYAGNVVTARILVAVTRVLAGAVDDYQASAAASGAAIGRLRESRRVSEVALDRSLRVLDDLQREDSSPTLGDVRSRAAHEALRLRSVLDDDGESDALTTALWEVAAASAGRGLPVELLTREVRCVPSPDAVAAVCAAVDAALEALATSTTCVRALVRLRDGDGGTIVGTVRSRRPVDASGVVATAGWARARGALDALGAAVFEPDTQVPGDPEWRFELAAGARHDG